MVLMPVCLICFFGVLMHKDFTVDVHAWEELVEWQFCAFAC